MLTMTYLDQDNPVVPVGMSREFVAALKDIDHDFISHEVKAVRIVLKRRHHGRLKRYSQSTLLLSKNGRNK